MLLDEEVYSLLQIPERKLEVFIPSKSMRRKFEAANIEVSRSLTKEKRFKKYLQNCERISREVTTGARLCSKINMIDFKKGNHLTCIDTDEKVVEWYLVLYIVGMNTNAHKVLSSKWATMPSFNVSNWIAYQSAVKQFKSYPKVAFWCEFFITTSYQNRHCNLMMWDKCNSKVVLYEPTDLQAEWERNGSSTNAIISNIKPRGFKLFLELFVGRNLKNLDKLTFVYGKQPPNNNCRQWVAEFVSKFLL